MTITKTIEKLIKTANTPVFVPPGIWKGRAKSGSERLSFTAAAALTISQAAMKQKEPTSTMGTSSTLPRKGATIHKKPINLMALTGVLYLGLMQENHLGKRRALPIPKSTLVEETKKAFKLLSSPQIAPRITMNWQGIFGHFLKSGFMIDLDVVNGKEDVVFLKSIIAVLYV